MKHFNITNKIQKQAALLIAVLLILSSVSLPINATTAKSKNPVTDKVISENTVNADADKPYGYRMLAIEKNGSSMQALYTDMDLVLSKYTNGGGNIPTNDPHSTSSGEKFYEIPSASFSCNDYNLSLEELVSVYFTYRADHPEIFFLPSSYLYSQSAQSIYLIISEDFVLQSNRTKYADLAQKKLSEFKSTIKNIANDYEIAVMAHDILVNENFYRYDNSVPSTKHSAHSIVGWLDGSGVVCEGYSKAFQYLLNNVGIECIYVTGVSLGQAHAWNAVQINNSWIWIDSTFNDQPGLPGGYYHYYFGLPNSVFLKDHTPGTRDFGAAYQVELPSISDSYDTFYYKQASAYINTNVFSSLSSTLAQNAKRGFDNNNYTVTLFAENVSAKDFAISNLNRATTMSQILKDNSLSLRCATTYSISTVSSADGGNGGCIIYIKFDYHPCDVDRNTHVEENDAELILDILCQNVSSTKHADTDQNGTVSIYDAVLVLKTIG